MSILKLENENLKIKKGDRILLKNINLTVEKGDKILFSGINGAGKSTLFKTLLGFITEDGDAYAKLEGGTYTFCDSDDFQELQKHIIYISQEDFIGKPFTKVRKAFLEAIHDEVPNKKEYLSSWLEKYKPFIQDDLDKKLIDKRIFQLSGGEKKFVAIIQSLLRCDFDSVKLAMIDEPVNNLDAKHIRQLSDLLSRIQFYRPDFAIILITHCHAFPKITKALEITPEKELKQISYQVHNCFGRFDADGFYQQEMNPS